MLCSKSLNFFSFFTVEISFNVEFIAKEEVLAKLFSLFSLTVIKDTKREDDDGKEEVVDVIPFVTFNKSDVVVADEDVDTNKRDDFERDFFLSPVIKFPEPFLTESSDSLK